MGLKWDCLWQEAMRNVARTCSGSVRADDQLFIYRWRDCQELVTRHSRSGPYSAGSDLKWREVDVENSKELFMKKHQISPEAYRYWRAFIKRAATPLQNIVPDLITRAPQSDRHLGIPVAKCVRADLCRNTAGVKIMPLSRDSQAIKRFEFFETKQHEIETAIGVQIDSWGETGVAQRSFSTPEMRRGDLTILTTREDAEHDWFIEMVLRLSRVMKKLVEEFKQKEKDTTF